MTRSDNVTPLSGARATQSHIEASRTGCGHRRISSCKQADNTQWCVLANGAIVHLYIVASKHQAWTRPWPLINLLMNLFNFTRASDKFVEYQEAEFLNISIHCGRFFID